MTPTEVADRLDRIQLDLRAPGSTNPPAGPRSGVRSVERTSQSRTTPTVEPDHSTAMSSEERSSGSVTTLEHPRLVLPEPIPHVLAPTNDLIDKMWTTSGDATEIDGWTIGELDTESSVFARRVFLGTIVTVTLALLVAAAWFVAGRGDASLASTVAGIEDASDVLADTLADTQPVIDDLADGSLDDRDAAATAATAVDAAARTLFSEASELPATDEAAQLRSETVSLSDRSIATARSLSRTTAYLATIDVMFNRPDYPLAATDEELGDVAEMTATWVSRFIATSSSLPAVNALADHRNEIVDLAESLPDWQSRYLDALRAGDVSAAGEVVGELEQRITGLDSDLTNAVSSVAAELDDQRDGLLTELGA